MTLCVTNLLSKEYIVTSSTEVHGIGEAKKKFYVSMLCGLTFPLPDLVTRRQGNIEARNSISDSLPRGSSFKDPPCLLRNGQTFT